MNVFRMVPIPRVPVVFTSLILLALLASPLNHCLAGESTWQGLSVSDLTEYIAQQKQQNFTEAPKDKLTGHAWRQYLDNEDYLDSADPTEWVGLAREVVWFLGNAQKARLSEILENRLFQKKEAFGGLDVWTVWKLRLVSQELGMPQADIYAWMHNWLVSSDQWKQYADLGEVNVLLDWAVTVRNQAGYDMTEVLDDIYGYIREKALNETAWLNEEGTVWMKKMVLRIQDKVTEQERKQVLENITALLVDDRDTFLAQDVWAMDRLREITEPFGVSKQTWDGWVTDWFTHSQAWRESSSKQLDMLYGWLADLEDKAVSADAMNELARFAIEKLAASPELDGSQWYFKSLAALFQSDTQRAYLLSFLVDEDGWPRRNIGRVLSTAYADTDEVDDWLAMIEQQVESAAGDPDRQAMWMLVRAEAGEKQVTRDEATRAVDWATRGISTAESDEVRLTCLEWVVNRYSRSGEETEAVAMIQEHAGQFQNPVFREQIAQLEQMMQIGGR